MWQQCLNTTYMYESTPLEAAVVLPISCKINSIKHHTVSPVISHKFETLWLSMRVKFICMGREPFFDVESNVLIVVRQLSIALSRSERNNTLILGELTKKVPPFSLWKEIYSCDRSQTFALAIWSHEGNSSISCQSSCKMGFDIKSVQYTVEYRKTSDQGMQMH